MAELISPVLNRLRQFVGDRRQSARRRALRRARLLFSVSIVSGATGVDKEQMIRLEGFTRDLSETGLALIVPSLRVGDRYLIDEDCTLHVVLLDLPTGQVEIYANPVRYERLAEPETGHLIGVQITQITDSDRARLVEFLQTLN